MLIELKINVIPSFKKIKGDFRWYEMGVGNTYCLKAINML